MDRKATSLFWIIPAGLLMLAGISYGLLASKLGFYWDDWTIAWYYHFLGAKSFQAAYALDRPLLAWIYQLTLPMLGLSPLKWQLFALITRWLTACALWWALHGVWPRKPVQTGAIAALFLLYPGFQQQHIAITYGNAFVILIIYLLSWGLTIWGLRSKRIFRYFYPFSILFALYSVFTAEHFFGLELLRPILIGIVVLEISHEVETYSAMAKRVFKLWLPFLTIDAAFLAWRLATPTPRAQVTVFSRLHENLADTLGTMVQTASQDVFEMGIKAWLLAAEPSKYVLSDKPVFRNQVVIIATAAVLSFALLYIVHKLSPAEHSRTGKKFGVLLISFGLIGLLAAGIPIWPTNLRITLDFPYDRFTLPGMFGASLLLVGLIEATSIFKFQNIALISLICGLSAGYHYQNALSYRMDWLKQRDFFWQLNWRAPAIQPGTVLLTSELPFTYDWDNSLTAPTNWNYAPKYQSLELPYLVYDVEGRMSSGLPALEPGAKIFEEHRITPFRGSTNQALVFFFQPPGSCLNFIASENDLVRSAKPRYFGEIAGFSDPALILPGETQTTDFMKRFFLPEPDPTWCYYYQKAALAYQQDDWETIALLGDEGLDSMPGPNRQNAQELLPFFEGYARLGKWQQAQNLALQAVHSWDKLQTPICSIYQDLLHEPIWQEEDRRMINQNIELLGCVKVP